MKLKAWHERQLVRDPEYAKAIAEIDYAQRVADAIVAERIRVGLTQEELADRAGTTQARISEIERGVGNPTLDTVERILAALRAAVSTRLDAASLLASITTVKAEAFGFTPALNGTIVVGSGTAFFAGGVTVQAGAPFLPLTAVQIADFTHVVGGAPGAVSATPVGVKPGLATSDSELALAA